MTRSGFELVYLPYISLRGVEKLQFGRVTLWNFDARPDAISDAAVRDRVKALLEMNRVAGRTPGKSTPISDIGIVTLGNDELRPLSSAEYQEVQEFRHVLFLCCLANNARYTGANASSWIFTSENFDVVRQGFVLDNDFVSEVIGTIIRFTNLGYRIGETHFLKPSYVNQPLRFEYDEELLAELKKLRVGDRALYRRIVRAASVFLLSYQNTHAVDLSARILHQATAFEVLFDLPEREQRRVFKDTVERIFNGPKERKFRYKSERTGKDQYEVRSVFGLWADRFYTLRNHIIHGERVLLSEYRFRGAQHHVLAAAQIFGVAVKRLINESLKARGKPAVFDDRLRWVTKDAADEFEEPYQGFQPVPRFELRAERFVGLFSP